MQCKDIPDEQFLAAVDETIRLRALEEGSWSLGANRWDLAAVLAGHPEDVGGAPVDYPEMPQNLVLAKASKLIRRGLLTGCVCGCRGEFERPGAMIPELVPVAVRALERLDWV